MQLSNRIDEILQFQDEYVYIFVFPNFPLFVKEDKSLFLWKMMNISKKLI